MLYDTNLSKHLLLAKAYDLPAIYDLVNYKRFFTSSIRLLNS